MAWFDVQKQRYKKMGQDALTSQWPRHDFKKEVQHCVNASELAGFHAPK